MPDFEKMTPEQKEAWKARTRAESERMLKRENREQARHPVNPMSSPDPAMRQWAEQVPKYTIDPNTGERTYPP